ncbi:MAG: TonB-dependent receptor plug domain-containing protein [Erythrobacter sp.]
MAEDNPGTDESSPVEDTALDQSDMNARRIFTVADFERFAPRNARDLAQQIPGFTIRDDDGQRGLGQADTNVLINGRRISGKSNGPIEALERIPVEDVVRLEIVDGASLDIGGLSGQVLNVITHSSGGITGQFSYSPQFRSEGTPGRFLDASISLAGGGENTEWSLGLENDSNRRGDAGIEQVFDGAGAVIDTRDEQSNFNSDRFTLSGSWTRTAANGNVLNATGQIEGFLFRRSENSFRSGIAEPSDRVRDFRSTEDEFNYEVGLDYSFSALGGELKLIAFRRFEDSPTSSSVLTTFADGSPTEGSVFARDADEGETIARVEFGFDGLGGDWQIAFEGVRNFLDITSTFEELDGTGAFQPVELDGATSRVDEDRGETSITYSRALSNDLQLQASLGAEFSQISQTGEAGLTRSFLRPMGFVALDWNVNSGLDLSGRIERVVGQLNFFDFVSSINVNEDRTNVTNANLVPPQSWLFELEASQDLGAVGSLNLRGFFEDVFDIVDQIPILGGGQAPGNIDAAQRYGLEGEVTLLSDAIGWEGTRLDVEFELSQSAVLDPLLGNSREISNSQLVQIDADLRHDFAGSNWAIGSSISHQERANDVRIDEISVRDEAFAFASVFIENKDVAGLTLRANVGNILDQRSDTTRTVFADRSLGSVDFIEDRTRFFGTIFTFDIEGSF